MATTKTLYLIETRAKRDYTCPSCQRVIYRGDLHFRHDPFPAAQSFRGEKTTHWCRDCIISSATGPKDPITRRLRIPVVRVVPAIRIGDSQLPLFRPLRVNLVGVGVTLAERLSGEPSLVHKLTPEEFEEFICDRLFAMGFEPRRVGSSNRKDGGIDILFWSRLPAAFPFLGAAQVKHHRDANRSEGSGTVRDFAGSIAGHPFNAGLLVTNTQFSPDAEWFARERAKLVRLRGFEDIRRWIFGNFSDEAEWREIPDSIELCPGVIIRIR